MIIHFICRGNAFRSIIAEAYLNSLGLKDLSVLSSGTAAILYKARNLANHKITLELLEEHGIRGFAKIGYGDQLTQSRLDKADITVCMNERVYDECLRCVTLPASLRVWSVADIGEPGRISDVESKRQLYREEAYQEIVRNVERLVSDARSGNGHLLTSTVATAGATVTIKTYARRYGVDRYTAYEDLTAIGFSLPDSAQRWAHRPPPRPRPRRSATPPALPGDDWIMIDGRPYFVAGYTPGGAPYRIYLDEMDDGCLTGMTTPGRSGKLLDLDLFGP